MKTAVSIPDDLFAAAEQLAERLGTSRSRLYALALEAYVARHSEDEVTAAINRVVDAVGNEDEAFVAAASRACLEATEW